MKRRGEKKKKRRKRKKGVDKRVEAWYSNQAVREMCGAADRSLKKFKKLLTSARQCVTIQKLSLISGNRANEKS